MATITDRELIEPGPREAAVREFATAAAAMPRAISARVALVRSTAGAWRVVTKESEVAAGEVVVGFQVFRGETADSIDLLRRIAWAVREVMREAVTLDELP